MKAAGFVLLVAAVVVIVAWTVVRVLLGWLSPWA